MLNAANLRPPHAAARSQRNLASTSSPAGSSQSTGRPTSARATSSCSCSIAATLGADEQRIHLGVNELDRWAWVDPDQLDHYVLPRIARRIRSIVDNGSRTSYLEHGTLPDRTIAL